MIALLSLWGVAILYQVLSDYGHPATAQVLVEQGQKQSGNKLMATTHKQRPVSIIRHRLKLKKLEYADRLRASLLRGMPKGTVVAITYRSSFMEHGNRGSYLKDLILVETTFPDGRKYAFNASYHPRLQRIVRTWGGHHGRPDTSKFTLR